MNNHHRNLVRLRAVASALAELNEKVVFVGGATVSLYATDSAAVESRPTDDIDVVIEVATYAEFNSQINSRLLQLGFINDITSKFIYRYKIHGSTIDVITVDIMPNDFDILGFSNHWYKAGVAQSILYSIDNRQSIRILTAPYFIATKLEAFNSFRHGEDARGNPDFEDIIYVFDNRNELLEEINQSLNSVRSYLQLEMNRLLAGPNVHENIYVHLEPNTASRRTERILKIWQAIAGQGDS
ncbi:hypothetical protein BH09BAC4_BH09BAC4_33460 [soil metagenome]